MIAAKFQSRLNAPLTQMKCLGSWGEVPGRETCRVVVPW